MVNFKKKVQIWPALWSSQLQAGRSQGTHSHTYIHMHANTHAHARTNTRTNAKTHACTNTNQLKNIVIHLITIITLIDPRYWSFSLSFSVHINSIMHANNSIMHAKSPSWITDYLEQNGHFSKQKTTTTKQCHNTLVRQMMQPSQISLIVNHVLI